MEISNNRLNHIRAVATKMRDYVSSHRGEFSCTPEEMFFLGRLHDIDYAFVDD